MTGLEEVISSIEDAWHRAENANDRAARAEDQLDGVLIRIENMLYVVDEAFAEAERKAAAEVASRRGTVYTAIDFADLLKNLAQEVREEAQL